MPMARRVVEKRLSAATSNRHCSVAPLARVTWAASRSVRTLATVSPAISVISPLSRCDC